ncbi:hypothetical protein M3M35_02435 [Fructilactobacillus myrtifloralis]|uniref:Monooxygenase n=1 Tax=Fructilactobacillus myrtifloralis TaxID=2940301 RepID=A0ABY5BPD7_9LACO|nr:hypothetical protein [Fructilactobacillus myrtifloralis]USS85543.1 hypothetical protein M3M35_02435 [Fructilactobacillus myrtifloralis]
MISQISVTFGSQAILEQIMHKYPERNLALFSAAGNAHGMQLVDYSGLDSIFTSPVVYRVNAHAGTDDWTHYIDYIEVNPGKDQRQVLDAQITNFMSNPDTPKGLTGVYYLTAADNSDSRILLTLWNDHYDCLQWEDGTQNAFIAYDNFKNDPGADYHEVGYQRFQPKA